MLPHTTTLTNASIPAFKQAKILVIGDVMLDRYWHGNTSRISPEAPVPIVRVQDREERPGGAANVALNIRALGSQAHLLGVTGKDEAAETLQQQLQTQGVDCHFQQWVEIPTITKLRVLSRHQQLIRLDFEESLAMLDPATLHELLEKLLPNIQGVVLSDYGKGTLNDPATCIDMIRAAGKFVLVDPKGQDFKKYRKASLITPNLSEFEAIVGHCANQAELERKGEHLRQELQLDALLITRSEQGMSLLRRAHAPMHLPAHAKEVFDVTGAGDTVIGVLAAALAAGEDLAGSVVLANLAASLSVSKLGAATVSIDELEQALHSHSLRGLADEDTLHSQIRAAQARGETVVMTNGCFDILHAGHVHYLNQARQLGDRLIVAVNDNDSVRRLKGETRPVNDVQARMAVLNALESVDWVVPFSEDTPKRLICKLQPDILVKGGDYQVHEIAGHECVLENGGQVLILDFLNGYSTTQTIEKMKEA